MLREGKKKSFYALSQIYENRLLTSFCLPVRPHGTTSLQILYLIFFPKNSSRKVKFHYNLTGITGTLHEDRYTFMIGSR